MLVAMAMASALWLPPASLGAGCPHSGIHGSGCSHQKPIEWNLWEHDENWGLLFNRNVCPVGSSGPCGTDYYGALMRRPVPPPFVERPLEPVPSQPGEASP